MLFKKELLEEVMISCAGEELEFDELDSTLTVRVVDVGDWVSRGKYEYCWWVFCYNEKFYKVTDSRSGSYYSDYYYGSEHWDDMVDCDQVVRVPVQTYEWRNIE